MAALNKEELMKLSPAERIEKLKELEKKREEESKKQAEERKKESEEAEKLLKQAEMDMVRKAFEEDKPPENIRDFTGQRLEETIAQEKIPDIPPENHIQYANPLNNAFNLYTKIKAYGTREEPLTSEQAQTVDYLYGLFKDVVDQISEEEQRIEQISSTVKRTVKEIMGEYHANIKYDSE
ncbi:MAG: hypothetical protein ABIG89_00540 [Candidatus Woesearchaeota archaeon]